MLKIKSAIAQPNRHNFEPLETSNHLKILNARKSMLMSRKSVGMANNLKLYIEQQKIVDYDVI